MQASPEPLKLLVSYSHKDEKLALKLKTHLQILKRLGEITTWHDREINPGEIWAEEISKQLETANIILLLVSADFLASDYCYGGEMKRVMEKHKAGEAIVIPVILRDCDWWQSPFSKLQALPKDGKPVTRWKNIDAAFADVILNIRRKIEEIRPKKEKTSEKSSQWTIMLSATVDDVDQNKLDAILEHLKKLTNDATITVKKVKAGSVILFLEGTKQAVDVLDYLIRAGFLKEVCGYPVKGVGLSTDPKFETNIDVSEIIQEIEKIENNRANIRRLIEQVKSPIGVIPFVGAGLSIPFGLPGWTEFLLTQSQAIGMRARIQKHLKAGLYEEAAEEVESAMTPFAFRGAIEDKYGDHNIKEKLSEGAVFLLPFIADGPVITTNFDRILEIVFQKCNARFEQVIYGAKPDLVGKALQQNRRRLLKLHGDWEEATDRILTKPEYEHHYGSSDESINFALPLPRLLKQLLTGRSILFLGCSLNQDRTVRLLGRVASEATEMVHYAVLEFPETTTKCREKTRYISKHNIRPIWYPSGKHEYVEPILSCLIDKRKDVNQAIESVNLRDYQ